MRALRADVVIIGSGMGGGTTAHALARRGVDVLVLERGQRLPRDRRTGRRGPSSPSAATSPPNVARRRGRPFRARRALRRRREHEGVRREPAALPRARFRGRRAPRGHLARLALQLRGPRALLRGGGADVPRPRRPGEDPTAPWRSTAFPYPAVEHEPYIADLTERLRAQGVNPSANAMGIDLHAPAASASVARRATAFRARSAPRVTPRRAASTRPSLPAMPGWRPGARVRRIVAARPPRGPPDRRRSRRTGEGHRRKFVLAAGAVNSAALLLARRTRAPARARERIWSGRAQFHDAQQRAHRRRRPRRRNDVTFQKTLSVNDWYLDGGDGSRSARMQLIGKVQGVMMKTAAPRGVPAGSWTRSLGAASSGWSWPRTCPRRRTA